MADKRVPPARPDLAAAHLQGKVEAASFVSGTRQQVGRGRTPLHAEPDSHSMRQSELLFGEIFTVYEVKNGWSWGQVQNDSYVGYLHNACLVDTSTQPDHRVTALATPLLPSCDVKSVFYDMLPLGAVVKIGARNKGFAHLAGGGFVFEGHLAPLGEHATDFVSVAERFMGVPYVWGGKTAAGLDCSGLIQTSLQAAGISAPRDTDMMEKALGIPVERDQIQRGDLVFWKGHMGVMLDGKRLLHANAFHMEVFEEALDQAIARIADAAGPVTSIKRL
jgi:cell wall-associated NlpC family hydrolase